MLLAEGFSKLLSVVSRHMIEKYSSECVLSYGFQVFLSLKVTPKYWFGPSFFPLPPFYLKHRIIYYIGPAGISLKGLRAVLD